jgi:hypothetical protein
MNIYLPIIIDERGEISVFNSKKIAEDYLEHYDINEMLAFDSKGNKLKLVSKIERKRILGLQTDIKKVEIQELDNKTGGIEELRHKLIMFLSKIHEVNHKPFPQENWDDYSTPELIDKVSEIALVK